MSKHIILTVCSGNMFRSPIAAFLLNRALANEGTSDLIEVTSRGIQGLAGTEPPKGRNLRDYPREWENARAALERYGINIDSHRSQVVTEDILVQVSLVLAMEQGVLSVRPNSLLKLFPDYSWKIKLFSEIAGNNDDIEDTWEGNATTYDRATTLINDVAVHGTGYIRQWITNLGNQK